MYYLNPYPINHITSHSKFIENSPLDMLAQSNLPEPVLVQRKHLARFGKRQVSRGVRKLDLAQQHTGGRPDMDSVAAPGIHVALGVRLDTVGDAVIGVRKDTAVHKERRTGVVFDVKSVAAAISTFLSYREK